MRIRPIHHTFGPHITGRYARRADALLLSPWTWDKTDETEALRADIRNRFAGSVHLFASGREALLALLHSLRFERGAEIIIQGYTCVALPNAIHAAGYAPVYADIGKESLGIDPQVLQDRMGNRTRAVIVQHTFGLPAPLQRIRKMCEERHIALIEDCAHVIPDATGPKTVGTEGDFLLFSLNRDKALSGIAGGAIVDRRRMCSDALEREERNAATLARGQIARLLLYAPLYRKATLVYGLLGLGKLMLATAAKLGFLPPVLTPQEKKGEMPPILHRLPEPCAALAHMQWPHLQEINDGRRARTAQYFAAAQERGWNIPQDIRPDLPLQKFPLYVENADGIRAQLKRRGIHLDDGWTGAVVCPRTVRQETTKYIAGSCPRAEEVARRILTLPTHPTTTEQQAKELLQDLHFLIG